MVCLDSNMQDPFEIIVGTYEQYLLGYKVDNIVNEYKMERTFATHSHIASVRSIASNKHYLASGGADDSVCLYDMNNRLESGKLVHHNDTVNCIAFTPEASHMFTCGSDGIIAAIRCGNWQVEKIWKSAHKGLSVNAMAIHPTGKIALSTGSDGILRTWNLVKGRQAYATNLTPRLKLDARNVTVLKWSPNGEKYLLAVNQRIDIYSVQLAGIDSEIKMDSRIVCVEFLKDDLIAIGLENGQIKFYDLEKSEQTIEAVAHDIRVKCMSFVGDLLITASSSGEIKLWRYSRDSLDMLQRVNCGARITCLTLSMASSNHVRNEETKSEENEVEETTKRRYRFREEVVIEKEDDWDVVSINVKNDKKKKKKRKHADQPDTEDIPSKKRKESLLKKKREENGVEEDENAEVVPRKKKKRDEEEKKKKKKRKRRANEFDVEDLGSPSTKKAKKLKKSKENSTSGAYSVKEIDTRKEPEINNNESVAKRKKKSLKVKGSKKEDKSGSNELVKKKRKSLKPKGTKEKKK